MMWTIGWAMAAGAACEPVRAELDATGTTGLAVRGGHGALEIVSGPGAAVEVIGEACDGARVRLVRDGGALSARVRGRGSADLVVRVPANVPAVTVFQHEGPVAIGDLDARVALVASAGTLEAGRVGHLRLANVAGDVSAIAVDGDLVVDGLAGAIRIGEVGGDVQIAGASGRVEVAERLAGN